MPVLSRAACCTSLFGVLVHAGIMDWFDTAIQIEVTGHRWERSIVLEKFQTEELQNWCIDIHKDAYHIKYSRRIRETKKVAQRKASDGKMYTFAEFKDFYGAGEKRIANDGQAYSWDEFRKFYGDQDGRTDGAWAVAKRSLPSHEDTKKANDEWKKADAMCSGACCPHCGTDTIYDDWCEYKADIWVHYKDAKSAGTDVNPYWPETADASDCTELGCIRRGSKAESSFIDLSEVDSSSGKKSGATYCSTEHGGWTVDQWRAFSVGYRSDAKRRTAYGVLCGSIKVPAGKAAEKRLANDGQRYTKDEFVAFYGESTGIDSWSKAQKSREDL